MIGDTLLLTEKHERVAREIASEIKKRNLKKPVIAIGGESGSGKSEVSAMLRSVLRAQGYKVKILTLDNYYRVPAEIRNEHRREKGMDAVGIHEINWDVVTANLKAFREGKTTTLPYIDLFTSQEDKLVTDFSRIQALIVDGLYACNAPADVRIFIDITYHKTKMAQIKRGKEVLDEFRLQVLEKEHLETIDLKNKSDYLITQGFKLIDNKNKKIQSHGAQRFLWCSDNLPLRININKNSFSFERTISGAAMAIDSVYRGYDSIWFGELPGIQSDISVKNKQKAAHTLLKDYNCIPLDLCPEKNRNSADRFFGLSFWPLFHYMPQYCSFEPSLWETYKNYNVEYFKKLKTHILPGDTIWIHGFHLLLLPALLREFFPENSIGFFMHIPFPSYEIFRQCPWRKEILEGMLGADLIGFHLYEYTRHFQSCVYRLLGYESKMGALLTSSNRLVYADSFTLGIDVEKTALEIDSPPVKTKISAHINKKKNIKTILSVERLDYSRGLLNKLRMIEKFLSEYSTYRQKVIFSLHLGHPYHADPRLIQLRRQIETEIKKLNLKYKTKSWKPIEYSYGFLEREELAAYYSTSDIFLVSSIREGLNLLTREYLACRYNGQGVLLLSEFTGGANDLPRAFLFNPHDHNEFCSALDQALSMPENENRQRYNEMMSQLHRDTAIRWAVDFFERLCHVKKHQALMKTCLLSGTIKTELQTAYHTAGKRLLLLDYNGTVTPHSAAAVPAQPEIRIKKLLLEIAGDSKNNLVIISDYRKSLLQEILPEPQITLIANSEIAVRINGEWQQIEVLSNVWKTEIKPFLESCANRTPGSVVLEKKYSLTINFDKVEKELAEIRSRELKEEISRFTQQEDLRVYEGGREIQIRNTAINKGRFISGYLQEGYDFILAAGDDWTNEPMFENLPLSAWTIRIGIDATRARFSLKIQEDFSSLLADIIHTRQ